VTDVIPPLARDSDALSPFFVILGVLVPSLAAGSASALAFRHARPAWCVRARSRAAVVIGDLRRHRRRRGRPGELRRDRRHRRPVLAGGVGRSGHARHHAPGSVPVRLLHHSPYPVLAIP